MAKHHCIGCNYFSAVVNGVDGGTRTVGEDEVKKLDVEDIVKDRCSNKHNKERRASSDACPYSRWWKVEKLL